MPLTSLSLKTRLKSSLATPPTIRTFPVSKGVISLQNDRGTSYQAYIAVQNELVKAVNELRDDFSMREFGKVYTMLDEDQQKIVRDCIPQNISEAEPKDVGKRR